jgi:hypothetical protein
MPTARCCKRRPTLTYSNCPRAKRRNYTFSLTTLQVSHSKRLRLVQNLVFRFPLSKTCKSFPPLLKTLLFLALPLITKCPTSTKYVNWHCWKVGDFDPTKSRTNACRSRAQTNCRCCLSQICRHKLHAYAQRKRAPPVSQRKKKESVGNASLPQIPTK